MNKWRAPHNDCEYCSLWVNTSLYPILGKKQPECPFQCSWTEPQLPMAVTSSIHSLELVSLSFTSSPQLAHCHFLWIQLQNNDELFAMRPSGGKLDQCNMMNTSPYQILLAGQGDRSLEVGH